MPKVSVIVPVYQCRLYLERCIRSILAQDVDLEVILVDDGSTDGSAALCDALAAKNRRIRVIHQKNAGVSAARNVGMDVAQGEFFQFVDGDDWLESGYSQSLLDMAEKTGADIVIAGYTMCLGEERRLVSAPWREKTQTIAELAGEFEELYFRVLLNSPVNKIYRRSLIECSFPVGMQMGEDFIFNMNYLCRTGTVAWNQECGYCYNKENETSATTARAAGSISDVLTYGAAAERFLCCHLPRRKAKCTADRILFVRLCTQLNSLARSRNRERFLADLQTPEIRRMLDRLHTEGLPREKRLAGFLMKHGWGSLLWQVMRGAKGRKTI